MREDLIKYYENIRSHYASYHNHKELSAWSGLALFVFISGIISQIDLLPAHKIASAISISIFTIFTTYLMFRYISAQLQMKDIGGAYVAASISILTDLVSKSMKEDELYKYLELKEYPELKYPELKAQSRLVLPIRFLEKADILNTRVRGFQDTTKIMMYGILFSISLLVIFSKWIQVII